MMLLTNVNGGRKGNGGSGGYGGDGGDGGPGGRVSIGPKNFFNTCRVALEVLPAHIQCTKRVMEPTQTAHPTPTRSL